MANGTEPRGNKVNALPGNVSLEEAQHLDSVENDSEEESPSSEYYEVGLGVKRWYLSLLFGLVNVGLLAVTLYWAVSLDIDALKLCLVTAAAAEAVMDVVMYVVHRNTGVGHPIKGLIKTTADLLLAIGILNIIDAVVDSGNDMSLIDVLPPLGPWIGGRLSDIALSAALVSTEVPKQKETITFEHYVWLGSLRLFKPHALFLLWLAPVAEAVAILGPEAFEASKGAIGDLVHLDPVVIWLGVGALIVIGMCVETLGCIGYYKPQTKKCNGCLGCLGVTLQEWTLVDLFIMVGVGIPASIYEFGLVGGALAGIGAVFEVVGLGYELLANGLAAAE